MNGVLKRDWRLWMSSHELPTSESVVINNNLMDLIAVVIQKVLQVHLGGVIGVRAEHHAAVLPVKWEVRYLWGAELQLLYYSLKAKYGLLDGGPSKDIYKKKSTHVCPRAEAKKERPT